MDGETIVQRVLRNDVAAQLTRLQLFTELLDRIFEVSQPYASSPAIVLLLASILKAQQSARAVHLLAQQGMVEEVLAIGRTLVEVTVNVCYLQGAGQQEIQAYLTFHPEIDRGYHHLLMQVSRQTYPKKMITKLAAFLLPPARDRKTRTNWTSHSLEQRAQLSDRRTGIPILLPLLSRCFPRGDAAIHGTVGSLDRFLEAVGSQRMPTLQDRHRELSEALFGVNLTLMSFCFFLDEHMGLGMHEAIDQASSGEAVATVNLSATSTNQ